MPLYYTLTYFGSGYLVLSFARRVSQVFQAVFSALFYSSPVSVSLQPLAGFPSASRPVQFAPTWWDPSHCFGKRRKKKMSSGGDCSGRWVPCLRSSFNRGHALQLGAILRCGLLIWNGDVLLAQQCVSHTDFIAAPFK